MVERTEHADAERAAKKKSGGKERMHKASKSQSKESWLTKTATQRQDVVVEN